ncbi:hypothetical protein [Mycolicibacterium bacteremicum]|uniref:hypothetical protein n=1 Tax=Mycolicibacterium bacteremicum TaxID=564198 RepID=UPI0026ECC340|nr:hypothetical protein [Mycolicibacterium bacteremicum]
MSAVIGRVVAGLLGATAGLLWVLCLYLVARSGFTGDPAIDPHGYALIFGTVVGLLAGLLFAVVLPAAFPAGTRRRASRVCAGCYLAVTIGLYTALYLH